MCPLLTVKHFLHHVLHSTNVKLVSLEMQKTSQPLKNRFLFLTHNGRINTKPDQQDKFLNNLNTKIISDGS